MVAVWLVSLDTLRLSGRRIHIASQAGSSDHIEAVNEEEGAQDEKDDGASVFGVAEILVENVVPYHNVLILDGSEKEQLRFWQHMVGQRLDGAAYVVKLVNVTPLDALLPLEPLSCRKFRGLLVSLDEYFANAATRQLGQRGVWMQEENHDVSYLAIRAPQAYLEKVCSGSWTSLVLPHMPTTSGSAALLVQWSKAGLVAPPFPDRPGDDIAAAELVLDQNVIDVSMDIIRAHASGLDPGDDFERVELQTLRRVIAILEETYDCLDEGMLARAARDLVGVGDSHVQTSRRQYQAAYLVKVLVMTNTLRNSSSLQETVRKAMRLVLPQVLLKPFETVLESSKTQFPHAATISRWRLLLDGAFMLLQRRLHQDTCRGNCIRYILADSSLQHRRDFEHIVIMQVRRDCLQSLWRASAELTSLWRLA